MTIKYEHLYCEICKTNTNCSITTFCRWHLKKYHPEYDTKKYYDDFIRKKYENVCKCGNKTNFISFNKGYRKFCSVKCQSNSIETKEKIKQTNLNNYGTEYGFQSEEIKNKINDVKETKYNQKYYNNRKKAKETTLNKYGVENISQLSSIKRKKNITCFKNFGVENPQQSEIIHKKTLKTLFEKYGVDNISKYPLTEEKRKITTQKKYGVSHYSKSIENREYNEKYKNWIPLEKKTDFEKYIRLVLNETKKNKKQLFLNWNNTCYYTNEFLNKNTHYNNLKHPVIDHKISIYFGFINGIDFKIIGGLNNLCICSREINGIKGIMCENEFKSIQNKSC